MLISDFLLVWKQEVERNRNHTESKKHQINKVKRFLLKIPAPEYFIFLSLLPKFPYKSLCSLPFIGLRGMIPLVSIFD